MRVTTGARSISWTRWRNLQPDNREVSGLQQKALAIISPQVDALVKLGDHLYLEEQLRCRRCDLAGGPDPWRGRTTKRILTRIERAQDGAGTS